MSREVISSLMPIFQLSSRRSTSVSGQNLCLPPFNSLIKSFPLSRTRAVGGRLVHHPYVSGSKCLLNA
jgi:hypothetical protein